MTVPPRVPERPSILAWRADRAPGATWIPVHAVVAAAVGAVPTDVSIDVSRNHVLHADPAVLSDLLADLVARARRANGAATGPGRREVVVTSVLLADAIEVEVADSGPVLSVVERAWLDRQRTRAARLGGTLEVRACPEGGTALTLRLPRRLTERRAA
jgi:signal transduction histidine kinase